MASTLRIGGLASGMDIDTMVSNLMKVARVPVDKLKQQKTQLEWKKEDYRTMNTQLLALRTEASKMRLQATFQSRKASSSDESVVSVSASTNAAQASYNIKVASLATATTVQSSGELNVDDAGKTLAELFGQSEKFSFTINGVTFSDVDPEKETLQGLLNKITSSRAGVTAFFATTATGQGKIVLSSKQTGAQADIAMSDDSGSFLTDQLKLVPGSKTQGTDAEVVINGVTTRHSSNSFTINGVTFNLNGKTDTAATVTVTQDVDAIYNSIKSFIDKYNEVIDKISQKVSELPNRDYAPLTDDQKSEMKDSEITLWQEKARSGMLYNDFILKGVLDKMRKAWSTPVSGLDSSLDQMSEYGITTGNYRDGGKLYIDENKLKEAITNDPDTVISFFTQKGTGTDADKGVGFRLYDLINDAIDSVSKQAGSATSTATVDGSYLGKRIADINKRISAKEESLTKLEESYWKKFTAMEKAIQTANYQSSWLAAQFSY